MVNKGQKSLYSWQEALNSVRKRLVYTKAPM